MRPKYLVLLSLALFFSISTFAADKPKITLDEFFNAVSFPSAKISPDGRSVIIATERADWDQNIFRTDLWLYRGLSDTDNGAGTLTQLTQSGHDSSPQWSPDGRWIAFSSERKPPNKDESSSEDAKAKEDTAQLYLISPSGGEAFPLTRGEEEVHAFAWSADSHTLYFATRTPWTKAQKDAYKKDWKDVNQYRAAERGDQIFSLDLADAIHRHDEAAARNSDSKDNTKDDDESDATPGSRAIASTPWHVQQLEASPDGRKLAFVTESVSERQEKIDEFEIYSIDLANASPSQQPHQLTHNEAQERDIRWDKESKHVFFNVEIGSVEGKYVDNQPRMYSVDAETGATQRWASDFAGEITHYAFLNKGALLTTGRLGTEVQLYSQPKSSAPFSRQAGWPGTYDHIDAAQNSPRVVFIHSTLEKPTEVYLAESIDKLQDAKPITSFNKLFTERDLPKGKPYRWKADDGTTIEGMLMYPPGKFEAKNLPMFTFIHGGPVDADGNHFEADWYQWDRLAANQGWLVFEPNYRGSSGYGDDFVKGIVPQLVSRPGKDILEGVDALVKDGIADRNHLAVGGYSYGGYMTNWLITQSTQWKVAVTGAGAVEHVANWGNDDTTFDDAYYLGGLPWEAAQRYHDEAAIFQMNKVRTPTHLVAGADDIRVAVAEDYLLDHALHNLGIPSTLLVFPGEGHSLDKNPWHGKIKVREELKWLKQYGGIQAEQ
ncbi:MAG TPA: prolyl oligopeptidase family serine peptidase [Terriglobales bacterium]|nr:prolyl oligopeptidase family serine peptidase [Terriglobales bacterium]